MSTATRRCASCNRPELTAEGPRGRRLITTLEGTLLCMNCYRFRPKKAEARTSEGPVTYLVEVDVVIRMPVLVELPMPVPEFQARLAAQHKVKAGNVLSDEGPVVGYLGYLVVGHETPIYVGPRTVPKCEKLP